MIIKVKHLLSNVHKLSMLAFFALNSAYAQTDHSAHMSMSGSAKPSNTCVTTGLECANATTPFFMPDGSLLLAWTAGGVVSVAQSEDKGKTFSPPIAVAQHGKSLDSGADARPQIVANSSNQVFLAYAFLRTPIGMHKSIPQFQMMVARHSRRQDLW